MDILPRENYEKEKLQKYINILGELNSILQREPRPKNREFNKISNHYKGGKGVIEGIERNLRVPTMILNLLDAFTPYEFFRNPYKEAGEVSETDDFQFDSMVRECNMKIESFLEALKWQNVLPEVFRLYTGPSLVEQKELSSIINATDFHLTQEYPSYDPNHKSPITVVKIFKLNSALGNLGYISPIYNLFNWFYLYGKYNQSFNNREFYHINSLPEKCAVAGLGSKLIDDLITNLLDLIGFRSNITQMPLEVISVIQIKNMELSNLFRSEYFLNKAKSVLGDTNLHPNHSVEVDINNPTTSLCEEELNELAFLIIIKIDEILDIVNRMLTQINSWMTCIDRLKVDEMKRKLYELMYAFNFMYYYLARWQDFSTVLNQMISYGSNKDRDQFIRQVDHKYRILRELYVSISENVKQLGTFENLNNYSTKQRFVNNKLSNKQNV